MSKSIGRSLAGFMAVSIGLGACGAAQSRTSRPDGQVAHDATLTPLPEDTGSPPPPPDPFETPTPDPFGLLNRWRLPPGPLPTDWPDEPVDESGATPDDQWPPTAIPTPSTVF